MMVLTYLCQNKKRTVSNSIFLIDEKNLSIPIPEYTYTVYTSVIIISIDDFKKCFDPALLYGHVLTSNIPCDPPSQYGHAITL